MSVAMAGVRKHDLILSDGRTHTTRSLEDPPTDRPSPLPRAKQNKTLLMEYVCVGLRLPPLISDGPGGSHQDSQSILKSLQLAALKGKYCIFAGLNYCSN